MTATAGRADFPDAERWKLELAGHGRLGRLPAANPTRRMQGNRFRSIKGSDLKWRPPIVEVPGKVTVRIRNLKRSPQVQLPLGFPPSCFYVAIADREIGFEMPPDIPASELKK